MSENMNYKINFDEIASDFRYKENSLLNHSHGEKCKIFPFVANETNIFTDFTGVMSEFSRMICDVKMNESFNVDDFINSVLEKIDEYEGENSKEVFKDIIKTMFIDEDKLVNFNIKTMNYINSSNTEKKFAKFLYNNLFDEDLKSLVDIHYNKSEGNILNKIVLDSLPKLDNKKVAKQSSFNYVPYVKEIFIKDLRFLLENEELYKNSLKRVLEYYYMFYISQLILKLSKFEKTDENQVEILYYTLSWESTSKNRTAYKFGWNMLNNYLSSIFAHAVTLELLNYHNLNEQLGYKRLFEIFSSDDREYIKTQITKIISDYKKHVIDIDWNNFRYNEYNSGLKEFDLVHELFKSVEYQFIVSKTRNRANDAYKNWYIKFVQANFGKRRGSLGYNLNLTEEDIILMTKLCINNNEKLKLSSLFKEFELRGMYFDRDSKEKIVQLYEKLSLLEKKSDSGDAQYVRSIL